MQNSGVDTGKHSHVQTQTHASTHLRNYTWHKDRWGSTQKKLKKVVEKVVTNIVHSIPACIACTALQSTLQCHYNERRSFSVSAHRSPPSNQKTCISFLCSNGRCVMFLPFVIVKMTLFLSVCDALSVYVALACY